MRVRVAAHDNAASGGSGSLAAASAGAEFDAVTQELAMQAAREIEAALSRLQRFATRRMVLQLVEAGRRSGSRRVIGLWKSNARDGIQADRVSELEAKLSKSNALAREKDDSDKRLEAEKGKSKELERQLRETVTKRQEVEVACRYPSPSCHGDERFPGRDLTWRLSLAML